MKAGPAYSLLAGLRQYRHEVKIIDYHLGFLLIFLTALILTTPLTPGYRLLRQAVLGPAVVLGWLYLAWIPYTRNDVEQWEVGILMSGFIFVTVGYAMRSVELLICFPPEENVYRLRQVQKEHLDPKSSSADLKNGSIDLSPEPIPQDFTVAKLNWGLSLVWSWRGIGWNYSCPLPESSRVHPYTRTSSRRDYIIHRLKGTVLIWFAWDLFRTLVNLTPATIYLSGTPGIAPPYSSLSTLERGIYSFLVSAKIIIDTDRTHVMASVLLVSIGGYMGWEGELWSPWGWPPLFSSIGQLWRAPGLATMWSKNWQGYFRRWLHVLAWIGIGENILGLTHSGESAHPRTIQQASPDPIGTPSPIESGRTSPTHPIPSPSRSSARHLSPRLALSNFAKSLIVFGLSGLLHDCGTLSLILLNTPDDQPVNLKGVFALTPFFILQPFALVFEALLKAQYRRWKTKAYPDWRERGTPKNLVFMERLVGFILTWVWLGWSAGWFVEGLTKRGMFSRAEGKPLFPSLIGGLLWNKWFH